MCQKRRCLSATWCSSRRQHIKHARSIAYILLLLVGISIFLPCFQPPCMSELDSWVCGFDTWLPDIYKSILVNPNGISVIFFLQNMRMETVLTGCQYHYLASSSNPMTGTYVFEKQNLNLVDFSRSRFFSKTIGSCFTCYNLVTDDVWMCAYHAFLLWSNLLPQNWSWSSWLFWVFTLTD